MAVSLKNYTLKYLLLFILAIIAVWAGLFYAFILDEVYDNVDDGLKNQKIQIVREAYDHPQILNEKEFGINQFRILPAESSQIRDEDELKNEFFYMPYDEEMEPYRVLTTYFRSENGALYQLQLRTSTVEEDDLLYNLAIALGVLYAALVISIFLINQIVLRKAFRPFKKILAQLQQYRFGENKPFEEVPTDVLEFRRLNEGINEMLQDNQETFLQQKNFIENASHELKTPISIIQNKIDFLIENGQLEEKDLQELSEIRRTNRRMADLVASLLMLSKIENRQFPDREPLHINEIIRNTAAEFEDWADFREITVKVVENGIFNIHFNKNLTQILMNNLLQNALKYATKESEVLIEIKNNAVIFSNESAIEALDRKQIFKRFFKKSADGNSTGLGLAIAKTIVEQSDELKIDYYFSSGRHHFKVFSKNS